MVHGWLGLVALLVLSGCVTRTEFPTNLPPPGESGRPTDTTYVVVNPTWTEAGGRTFNRPRGVLFGYDRSVYICDTENDRVVHVSIAGEFIEEYPVPHPVQMTQDRQLNLVCVDGEGTVYRRRHFGEGEFDTAFYRDSMNTFVIRQRQKGDSVIVETLLVRIPTGLVGIAASPLPDRYYYIVDSTRSTLSLLDVNDHGLAGDLLRAFARRPANDPVGIMTYPTGETSYNIVLAQWGPQTSLRIVRSGTFEDVRLETADIYEMLPVGPKQVVRDEDGNFLVVAALDDEVYRFTRHGRYDFRFGETGAGPGQFSRPDGIAYGEKTLYIADTGNDRIVRLRLSTDLQY